MDINTVILILGISSFVFGFLLVIFKYQKKESSQWIPIWITAKFLQGAGSIILYFRSPSPEFITMFTGNNLVLLGCAYESWAVFYITGNIVNKKIQHFAACSIVTLSIFTLFLNSSGKLALIFFLHTFFYFLPGWILLKDKTERTLLRSVLGFSFIILATIFFIRFIGILIIAEGTCLLFNEIIHKTMVLAVFCMILISGFSMLLLANEKSYFALQKAQEELQNLNKKLEKLSNTDGLTNIANRRAFDEKLLLEYNRLCRKEEYLSLIMIDIDYFKAFNDYYGHLHGDNCLKKVSNVIASNISRAGDIAARYGGEEFACILPATNLKGSLTIAEAIRLDVENLFIEHKKSKILNFVTISLGVSTIKCSSKEKVTNIVNMADQALYKAKINGRNRIEFIDSSFEIVHE